ncbi:hypothetical protein [Fulvivirga ligni]|uniref:hypothetical protein n=1 Tax=Fulvivirga ligni TaxID=2904246 RepID=UPI001F198DF6|nr:hypothetical protein [Fulvivirga ligni]UII21448.1 hypothetical protein LVD16_26835 [Fulvivirga ligni]
MNSHGNSLSEKEIKELFREKKFVETDNNALKVDRDYFYESPHIKVIYDDMKR